MSTSPILVVTKPLERSTLAALVGYPFPDMVKFVADVEREIIGLGGELHADAEAILLEHGSRQASLWGGNYYPGTGSEKCIEFSSLINIRPSQGNRSLAVQSPELRDRIRDLVFRLVGRGESLT